MITSSINGIYESFYLMDKAALEAQKGVEGDLIQVQADSILAEHMLNANLSVLKTVDEMYKSVIDIFA
jgi:flagellar basal body rod protein FlgC